MMMTFSFFTYGDDVLKLKQISHYHNRIFSPTLKGGIHRFWNVNLILKYKLFISSLTLTLYLP